MNCPEDEQDDSTATDSSWPEYVVEDMARRESRWRLRIRPADLALFEPHESQPLVILRERMQTDAMLSEALQVLALKTPKRVTLKLSPEAMAAAMPAGILSFTLSSIFIGTAGYVNTFVAQYFGARRPERIGPSVWQGLYVAAAGGIFMLFMIPIAGPFFDFIGHDPRVRVQETLYFRTLCTGSFFHIAASSLAGFYSGRGKNWPIAAINGLNTAVNVTLNYFLIFGHGPFPARWSLVRCR